MFYKSSLGVLRRINRAASTAFHLFFSYVGLVLFPCSLRLKPSTLRRTLVFAFWGCSKSDSLNGLSFISLTQKQLACCTYFTSSLPISHLACFALLTRCDWRVTKVNRVGPMLNGLDASTRLLRHEWEHLRCHHCSSMGDTKVFDGGSKIYLDGVISLDLNWETKEFATQPPIKKGRQNKTKQNKTKQKYIT